MDKTYRESRLTILGLLFSLFVLFLFSKIFIASIESENGLFILLMAVVCLLWLKVIYNSIHNIFKKIVVRPQGLFIYNSWKSHDIRWEQMREFGRIEKKKFFRSVEDSWEYYLIKGDDKKRPIKLGDSGFKGMDEIVAVILKKAKHATCVTKKNVAPIPWMKKFETISWEQ
ncbi:MAG: hypothetical protein ACOY90_06765 [Candidatus Zhuqueibacterota bacterium]